MESVSTSLSDEELISALRRCASIWFKNSDLLLLEEFIRRFNKGVCHESRSRDRGDHPPG
jgi:hypothetical protein